MPASALCLFSLTAKELTALKKFVNSDDGRHATLTVEDVEEAA